jgi:hypothetical protein
VLGAQALSNHFLTFTARTDVWEPAPTQEFDVAEYIAETQRMCDEHGVSSVVETGPNKRFHKYKHSMFLKFDLVSFLFMKRVFAARGNPAWIDREKAMPSCRHRRFHPIYTFTHNTKTRTPSAVYCVVCIQRVRIDGSTESMFILHS